MRSFIETEGPRHAGASTSRAALLGRIGRITDYLFGVLYVLFAVRFLLELFGARSGAGFSQIIRGLTDVFYAPFRGLFATTVVNTGHFVWPLLVAIMGYMLLHAGIRGLLHLIARA